MQDRRQREEEDKFIAEQVRITRASFNKTIHNQSCVVHTKEQQGAGHGGSGDGGGHQHHGHGHGEDKGSVELSNLRRQEQKLQGILSGDYVVE